MNPKEFTILIVCFLIYIVLPIILVSVGFYKVYSTNKRVRIYIILFYVLLAVLFLTVIFKPVIIVFAIIFLLLTIICIIMFFYRSYIWYFIIPAILFAIITWSLFDQAGKQMIF
jgi:hypothetical protein